MSSNSSPSLHSYSCSSRSRPGLAIPSLFWLPLSTWNAFLETTPSKDDSTFRIDWFDLLVVQGTLKSLPQHHNQKASILQHPALVMVQFLDPYMSTGKTIALTIWNFVGKVMSLLFNVLFRFTLLTAIFSYAENGWCIVGSK